MILGWRRFAGWCVSLAIAGALLCFLPSPDAAPVADGRTYAVWVFLEPAPPRAELPLAIGAAARARRSPLPTDYPVDPAVVERIRRQGARVRYASRWLQAVAVDADRAALERLRRLPGVRAFVPVRTVVVAGEPAGSTALQDDSTRYGVAWAPLRELNIPVLHTIGFTGSTQRIAILDTGFAPQHETLVTRRIGRQRDFINGDDNVANQPGDPREPDPEEHGTAVWSLLGGYAPERLIGGAYDAEFFLAKVDVPTVDTRADEDRWVAAVEWADSLGANLINSSVGFRNSFIDRLPIPYGDLDGNTTVTTIMADQAARRGIVVVVAIGNGGAIAGSLWAPSDADSALAVGGSEPLLPGRLAVAVPASGRGPTADGRTKPDLAARGRNLIAAGAVTYTSTPTFYQVGLTGSSYATPLISAGAALMMEAWPSLSVTAVRQALLLAGSNARTPDINVGYGVPDVAAAVMMPEGLPARVQGPLDLQGNVTTIAPTFEWTPTLIHPRLAPIRYLVEVAADAAFNQIVASDTVTQAFSLTLRQPLPPMARAFFRVTAISHQAQVRRESFSTVPFGVPDWVRLLVLAGPQTDFITDLRPELSWAPLRAPAPFGPFRYDVQVLSLTGQVVQEIRNHETSSVRVPLTLTPNQGYRWRVIAKTRTGAADTVESTGQFVIISDSAPPATLLYQNFPNPFPFAEAVGHDNTRIWFDLAERGTVDLAVFDLRGRLIRRLIPAAPECGSLQLPPGLYGRSGTQLPPDVPPECVLLEWDARDHRGEQVPRGIYILRLRAGGTEDWKRMVYVPG